MADIIGTADDDVLNGGDENDLIQGLDGNDQLFGGAGVDQLEGGDGDDILDGGADSDLIFGGDGDDTILASGFVDEEVIRGDAGTDFLDLSEEDRDLEVRLNVANQLVLTVGGDITMNSIEGVATGDGDDFIVGSNADNLIRTGGGDDFYIGAGNGSDNVDLGDGDDRAQDGGAGADVYDGGAGRDTLDYSQSVDAISIVKNANGDVVTTGGRAAGDVFSNFEIIFGSNRGDTITAVNGLRDIFGGGGNDTLFGSETSENLFGGNGNDQLTAGINAELLDGGSGDDVADYRRATEGVTIDLSNLDNNTGFAAGDTYSSIETFIGSAFDDVMIGTDGNDRFFAHDGNDRVNGGAGADRLDGGDGIDTLDYSTSSASVRVNLGNNSVSGGDAQGDNISGFENLIGSAFGDEITGTGGDNFIQAGAGNDTVHTGNGADTVDLGAGGDIVIDGGNGADSYDGGTGDDTLSYANSAAAISITQRVNGTVDVTGGRAEGDTFTNFEAILGSGHSDTITAVNGLRDIFGRNGNDTLIGSETSKNLFGGNGNDRLFAGISAELLGGDGGTDTADYGKATEGLTIDLSNLANNTGFAAGDTYDSIENFEGSVFDDVFIGTTGTQRFFGDDGNDLLIGGAGADRLDGGNGIDTVDYSASGGAVNVQLHANSGSGGDAQGDVIINVENLIGSAFGDIVAGTDGDNVIETGDGDDLVNARGGFDTIDAGAGNDTIRGSVGADLINGGTGFDTLEYNSSNRGVIIGREGPVKGGFGEGDVFFNIEQIFGSAHADLIALQDGVVNVEGRNGNDQLTAFGGTFTLNGGNGDDVLELVLGEDAATGASFIGGFGGDTLLISGVSGAEDFRDDTISIVERLGFNTGFDQDYEVTFTADQFAGFTNVRSQSGFRGNEELTINIEMGDRVSFDLDGTSLTNLVAETDTFVITGGAGEQRIDATALNDTISTGDGDDTIRARAGDDIIDGGNGNDTLLGENGNDTIEGGDGNDSIFGGDGDDLISGGEGADTINGNNGNDIIDYSTSDAAVNIDLQAKNFTGGHASGDSLREIEGIIGTRFADELTGLNSSSIVNTIDGAGGNDTMNGLGGNDVLSGGTGNDKIFGGAGTDRLLGGTGRDLLEGGAGADLIDGQQGKDTVSYESSSVGVRIDLSGQSAARFGDAEGDLIRNIENAIGSDHDDNLTGSRFANAVRGGDGNDHLNGLGGKDKLYGGDGDDTLVGGTGNDKLYGGAGEDRAIFSGQAADFDITVNDDLSVTIVSDAEGTDKLVDIESISFDDQTFLVEDLPRVIIGTSGPDNVNGGGGNDKITLGDGDDVANGGGGDDTIRGQAGNDTIGGGAGTDKMFGGGGSDTFFFAEGFDMDTVRDFEQGVDKVELDIALFAGASGIDVAQDVIDTFGRFNSAGTALKLDFGDGDVLRLIETDGFAVETLHEDFIFV